MFFQQNQIRTKSRIGIVPTHSNSASKVTSFVTAPEYIFLSTPYGEIITRWIAFLVLDSRRKASSFVDCFAKVKKKIKVWRDIYHIFRQKSIFN